MNAECGVRRPLEELRRGVKHLDVLVIRAKEGTIGVGQRAGRVSGAKASFAVPFRDMQLGEHTSSSHR